jgi:hypothetical protein
MELPGQEKPEPGLGSARVTATATHTRGMTTLRYTGTRAVRITEIGPLPLS